jgi:hypothetical protein
MSIVTWKTDGRSQGSGSTTAANLAEIAARFTALGATVEVGTGDFSHMISIDCGGGRRALYMASSTTKTPDLRSPDTWSNNVLYHAVAEGITTEELGDGTASGNPFGGGAFSGWWRCIGNSSINGQRHMTVLFSDDGDLCALEIDQDQGGTGNNTVQSSVVGLLVDAAAGNQYVGMAGGGGTVPSADIQGTGISGPPFMHGNSNTNSHAGVFIDGEFVNMTRRWSQGNSAISNSDAISSGATTGFEAAEGYAALLPIIMQEFDNVDLIVGQIRGVYYWKPDILGRIVEHDPVGTPDSPSDPGNWVDGLFVLAGSVDTPVRSLGFPLYQF